MNGEQRPSQTEAGRQVDFFGSSERWEPMKVSFRRASGFGPLGSHGPGTTAINWTPLPCPVLSCPALRAYVPTTTVRANCVPSTPYGTVHPVPRAKRPSGRLVRNSLQQRQRAAAASSSISNKRRQCTTSPWVRECKLWSPGGALGSDASADLCRLARSVRLPRQSHHSTVVAPSGYKARMT